jgi:hypothetical protein
MGACQSSSAASNLVPKVNKAGFEVSCCNTKSSSRSCNDADYLIAPEQGIVPENVFQADRSVVSCAPLQRIKESMTDAASKSFLYKVRPGYSSGGSSFMDSCDENTSNATVTPVTSRHDKLCEWKQQLAANKDFSCRMVRIEVRRIRIQLTYIDVSRDLNHSLYDDIIEILRS